jgi:hypothetical protein
MKYCGRFIILFVLAGDVSRQILNRTPFFDKVLDHGREFLKGANIAAVHNFRLFFSSFVYFMCNAESTLN